jgi:hypothetical protein
MQRDTHGVYSGLFESTHARVVVLGVVHAVNTDGIDAELCQIRNIASTSSGVGQGVNVS